MGLFDIFRRRAKKRKEESTVKSEATQSEQSLSAASANDQSQVQNPAEASQTTVTSQTTTESNSNNEQSTSQESESTSTSETNSETTQTSEASLTSESTSEREMPTASVEQSVNQEEPTESETAESVSETAESSGTQTEPESSAAQQPETENEPASSSAEQSSENEADNNGESSESAEQEEKEQKYEHGLEKSRHGFGARLNAFLANFRHVDEDFFDDLEDMLIESDVGYEMTMKLSDELREEVKLQNAKSKQEVSNVIIEKMVDLYEEAGKGENPNINFAKEGPTVIMFVGVNGAGKTTTIGKMAAMYKRQGKKVLLAAADTFRAGAVEQLDVWAKRDGVDIVTGPVKGDPAAVVYDAVKKAKDENYDILFVDTAGRLQNKVNLMKELNKMKRVLTREIPEAPHEVLLVLDATTGQNALNQAKDFQQATDVTGIVLTKLDGTARGGIVLAIRNELHLPVKYVGLGEHVDDLQKFDANEFVYGLFKGLVTPEE